MKFSEVISGLKQGHSYARTEWCREFITLQISADIPGDVIPEMTSLRNDAKKLLLQNGDSMIHYRNQVLRVSLGIRSDIGNVATYYVPTWTDIFAEDWVRMD